MQICKLVCIDGEKVHDVCDAVVNKPCQGSLPAVTVALPYLNGITITMHCLNDMLHSGLSAILS